MYPGMTFLIASYDPDFIADMTALLHSRGAVVYAATTAEEIQRLEENGVIFEACIVDPFFNSRQTIWTVQDEIEYTCANAELEQQGA